MAEGIQMKMSDELDKFLKGKQHASSKYRRLFTFADVVTFTFLLYAILLYFNMDQIFFISSNLESYATISYQVGSFTIEFSNIALFCFSFVMVFLVVLLVKSRSQKKTILSAIEDKYPPLKERLRTAYDNREGTNIIAVDLLQSVVKSTENVKDSILLDKKRIRLAIVFLIASTVLASGVSLSEFRSDTGPTDIQETLENLPFIPNGEDNTPETSPLDDNNGPSGENIIGDPSVIIVEGEEVDLTLPPGSETGFTDAGEDDSLPPDFKPSSSYDVGRMSSSAYYEQLPEGYEDIIKSYFEEITKQ